MPVNIMEQFSSLLTDNLVARVTDMVGGEPAAVYKGLELGGAAILASAIDKSSDTQQVQNLFSILGDGSVLSNLDEQINPRSELLTLGTKLSNSLLADKTEKVTTHISKISDLDQNSANTLLNTASGLIGGLLGRQKTHNIVNPTGLATLLSAQGSMLGKLAPSLAGFLGIGSLAATSTKLNVADNSSVNNNRDTSGGSLLRKIILFAVIFLLALLLFFFLKSCNSDQSSNTYSSENSQEYIDESANTELNNYDAEVLTDDALNSTEDASASALDSAVDVVSDAASNTVGMASDAVDSTSEAIADASDATADAASAAVDKTGAALNSFGQAVGEFFSFSLPNGEKLNIPSGGFEEKFLKALSEDSTQDQRYILDRLFFATGAGELNPESREQISNTAAILKAYPDYKIVLRGHTDNTGSEEINIPLSKSRADSVRTAIINLGVDEDRISTMGLAAREPIADNSTEQGRRLNRRIDIVVKK